MKEKIKIISDGETAQVFIEGEKVKCTDMELHFIGHADKKPMITIDARWNKMDENGTQIEMTRIADRLEEADYCLR